MVGQPGFFDLDERYAALSAAAIRSSGWVWWSTSSCSGAQLDAALARSDRARGGRPPFDHVLMFKVLILQAQNNLSDERTEFYLRDRLTWMRFLRLGLGDPVPDANTIWTLREALTKAGATLRLFELFDRELRAAGYIAMSGQRLPQVGLPPDRLHEPWTRASCPRPSSAPPGPEKQAIKEGRIPKDWQQRQAKLRQRCPLDRQDAKAKPREGETPMVDLAIPAFGYQNHISTDRRHRLIRRWLVTDAAAHAGARLAVRWAASVGPSAGSADGPGPAADGAHAAA